MTRRLTVGRARLRRRMTRRPSFFVALRVGHRRRSGRSMIAKTRRFSTRPCDQENTWSETVISPNRFRSRPPAACTSEADGRLCRHARLQIMCERPRPNAKAAGGKGHPPAPLHDVKQPAARSDRAADLVPAAHFLRPGWCVRLALSPPHLRCVTSASAGSRPSPWRQLQLRPRNEGAGGAPGGVLALMSRW